MDKFIRIISITKWIGWIGIIGNLIYPHRILRLIGLFILLGLIELFFTFTLRTFCQAIQQLASIPYTYLIHNFCLPSYLNYTCKGDYILPFEGKWDVVNGGIDKAFSHSWSILTQRYAYDFIILDDEGHSFREEETNPSNYYCYGKNVIAPADGEVVQVNSKLPDSKIFGNGRPDYKIRDIRGNFVIIKHFDREYSFIAHIMPGSILVKKGQKVRQGEVIAQCGNSGNTSEPHVHFHLQDGKSVFSSAGLPVRFGNIRSGERESYKSYDPRPMPKASEVYREKGWLRRGLTVETER